MHLLLLFAASAACPVLNAATAGGALGGAVQTTVTRSDKSTGFVCQFVRPGNELNIEVSALSGPDQFAHFLETACQGGRDVAPLKAIGNEAVACSLGKSDQIVEKAVGRVRNQAFVIRFSTTANAADGKAVRGKTTALAEQVAGSLF